MKVIQSRKFFVIFAMLSILGGMIFSSLIACAAEEGTNVTKKITKKNTDFKVNAEYGIDGFVLYDCPTVVKVTVESDQNFTGTLRITPAVYEGQKKVAYAQDISLAKGETNTFTFIPSTLGENSRVDLEILDEKNKVVYAETDRPTYSSYGGGNMMIGVLSDDYSALNYFDGIFIELGTYQGTAGTLELTPDSIQGDSSALAVLNYIIIDNFDTAHLSDKQYEILKDWVNNGGVLILSLGANYQNVLHIFSDDFITGTLGNLEKTELNWFTDSDTVSSEDDGQEMLTLSNVDVIDVAFDDAAEITGFSEDGTAYKKTIGAGAVVVLAYDLGMEPMTSFADRKTVAVSLLETTLTKNMIDGNNPYTSGNMMYNGMSLAKLADNARKPSALLYGGLLFFYVIIVGPILYLILKVMKKREKIWIAIPVVSLFFTGCIYLTGFIYRVNKPIVNTFSIVSVEDGVKEEKVYTSITCPKAQQYSININNGYTGFQNQSDYYYGMFTNNSTEKAYDYMVKQKNDGMEISMNNGEVFSENSFIVSKVSENDIGTIDCDLNCYTTGFEGTITNNTKYDLTNVVITFETHFYQAGDLKKGEQVEIDPDKIFESVGYGAFENLYSAQRNLYTNRELYKNYEIDTAMENNYVRVHDYNHGCIWAGIASYEPAFVDESEVKLNGHGIIFQSYTEEYADVDGFYYPNLDQMILTYSGDYDTQDGMLYNGDVTITYSFEGYPGITRLENLSYGKIPAVNYGNPVYANVYAYNADTGDYDLVFGENNMISSVQLEKYMNGNVLILRYEVVDSQSTSYIPRIVARGDK